MNLFSKTKSYLGVDIGTSSIKIVELADQSGRPRLVTYGYIDWPTNIIKSNASETRGKIIYLIKAICQKANTKSRKAITALPSFSTFSSIINLPQMPKKDLSSAVLWEAKKFVPMPIEEVVLDWKIIKGDSWDKIPKTLPADNPTKSEAEDNESSRPQGETKKNIRILLTAAPKNLIRKYIEIFKDTGLELLGLETESFALGRSLIGYDSPPVMIIDLGAVATDIIIIEKSIPLLTRSIDIGGATITKSIMNTLNVSEGRAEQFKRDIGVPGIVSVLETEDNSRLEKLSWPGLGASRKSGGVPRVIREGLDVLLSEIRYSLDLYHNQSKSRVERIILSGGSAFLPHLVEYFSQSLALKVYIGDPWSRVMYPLELKLTLEELGPRFALAIGLAMREIE